MGSRIRTVHGHTDRPVLVPFDIQIAFKGELKLIVGEFYSEEDYYQANLKLLPEPKIIDGVVYIFTVEDKNMSTYYYREEVNNGRFPYFTEKGICDVDSPHYNLNLVRLEREYWSYETT